MTYVDEPNKLAHATAVVLRAAALASGYPNAFIQDAVVTNYNAVTHLVCWPESLAVAWVWHFLHRAEIDDQEGTVWPPKETLKAVLEDQLSVGRKVLLGPSFADLQLPPRQQGFNAMRPGEVVTVEDGPRPGIQVYRRTPLEIDSPEGEAMREATIAAVFAAAHARQRVSEARAVVSIQALIDHGGVEGGV